MFSMIKSIWNFFDGYKTYIAGTGLLCLGLGSLLTAVGHCIQDVPTIVNGWEICQQDIAEAYNSVLAALAGLGFIGVKSAISK